jgi:hypothetical protein
VFGFLFTLSLYKQLFFSFAMAFFSFGNEFPANVKVLVIDHDIDLLNAIEKTWSQFNYQGL